MRRGPGRPANTPEVLWSKVDKRGPDECWPWRGVITEKGYGRTEIGGRNYYAHRVIFSLVNPGAIELAAPKDRNGTGFLRHSCDNRVCCNPKHLSAGTHAQNMADKVARNRSPDYKGERGPRAKLTNQQAKEVRWLSSIWLSSGEIARVYGVSKPTIKSLVRGRTY